jgi:dethiobiotin synthetase
MKVLVTGTDTGVGKTWVACALVRALQNTGQSVVAIKPIETGCGDQPNGGEDGVRLARATGQSQPSHAIIRLREAVAPVIASERAGAEIDFDALMLKIERFTELADAAIIEGTGGLLAPVTWEWNMADLARALGATALVVAPDRLGTINHTLLTLSALELAGIPTAAVVLTPADAPDRSSGTNGSAIERLSGIDRVLTLPAREKEGADPAAFAPVLEWLARTGEPFSPSPPGQSRRAPTA